MKQSKLTYCVLLALASTTATAAEQNDQTNINYFDTVVVTASKTAQRLGDVDGTITVIGQDEMQRNVVQSVDDVFQNTPGVTVGNSSIRGEKPINIRGITGNRILTTVDGVKQAKNLSWGSLNSSRHFVDPNTLKSVEVVTSPASSLYGSDALGGVVSYTTKDAKDLLQAGKTEGGQAKVTHNSANANTALSVGISSTEEKGEALLIITKQQGAETQNTGDLEISGATREVNDPQDTEDLSVLTKYKLKGKNQTLTLTGEQVVSDTFTNQLSSSNNNASFDEQKTRQRLSADYEFNRHNRAFDKVQAKVDWQQTKTEQLQKYDMKMMGREFPYSYDADYNERITAFSLYFDKAVQTGNVEHNIKYGLTAENARFEQIRTSSMSGTNRSMPLTKSQSYAAFVQDQIDVNDKLTITPGVRYDKTTIDPKPDQAYLDSGPADETPEKHTESRTSFKLGATYDITPNISAFGQFAQGFKAPDMDELFASFANSRHGYKIIANPDLKPEKSDSFELGARFDNGKVNAELVTFHNEYENFIEQIDLGAEGAFRSVMQNQNLAGVKIKGLEAKAAVQVNKNVKVKGGIAYAKGTYEKDGETKPLNSVSPIHGSLGVAYTADNKNWGTELRVKAAQGKNKSKVDGDNAFLPGGYSVADITAYKKLGKNVRFDAGIFNVADKRYWEWDSARGYAADDDGLVRASEAGRHVKAALTWNF